MNILEKIPFKPDQAVVFDIDDTLISTKTGMCISNVCNLYHHCRQKGYSIYIITARGGTQDGMNFTMRQLQQCGINGYKKVFFRPPYDLNIPLYKKNARKSISETVVMSVGDQPWDIGEYGGAGVLVQPPPQLQSYKSIIGNLFGRLVFN